MNPDIIEKANIIVNESDAAYIGVNTEISRVVQG